MLVKFAFLSLLLVSACTQKPAAPAAVASAPSAPSAAEANAKVRADEQASLMTSGLGQLAAGNAAAAAEIFRRVLAINPTHYGAHYQLAMALERSGDAAGAKGLWAKVLTMATEIHDEQTVKDAKTHLGL